MTNKELQEILSKYPPDMPMQVSVSSFIFDITMIDQCIDMDTNKPSLVVYGRDREYFKQRVGEVFTKKFCRYELE